ncbi:MAG: FAD-dependent oxidoreductase [Synergistaceae bacterium]|nr:FAD-dependent oxidoreductase [Synergistaceae bacterium]
MRTKFLILGAGPAGLSFSNRLFQNGERDFIVLEAEAQAGGLCRSVDVDGYALDIGGGHILDVRRTEVVKFLFQFMSRDEWNYFVRDTTIHINGKYVSHPFEANIWQFNTQDQAEYLASIARAGCVTGKPKPEKFTEWITWKLGERIAQEYMLPYNKKMFGSELDNLGTYWLEKLPDVSFEDTLRSCLEHRAYAKQPGHSEFYYPVEHGYGELWLRMAGALDGRIAYGQKVNSIDFDSHIVRTEEGREFSGEVIINTIPYAEFRELQGMPESLRQKTRSLKHTSVQVKYSPQKMDTSAQWIYYPDPGLSYHRIFVRHNVLLGSKGIWYETNSDRIGPPDGNFAYINEYAYPLNTIGKPEIMRSLLEWMAEHNVFGLGRWGEHQHYNSDTTVELALKLADKLL